MHDVTALILAGGQASRMGGADKGLLQCMGRPLIEHVLRKLTPLVGSIVISANRNQERYALYGHPVLNDTQAGYAGPLAGIERGLEACTTPYLWVLPCDAPAFTGELLRRLKQVCADPHCAAALPYTAEFAQPTFTLMRADVLGSLRDFLADGQRKAMAWLTALPARTVDCTDHPEWFANINTPAELEQCGIHPGQST